MTPTPWTAGASGKWSMVGPPGVLTALCSYGVASMLAEVEVRDGVKLS